MNLILKDPINLKTSSIYHSSISSDSVIESVKDMISQINLLTK
jgi:hypothetical protein